MIDVTVLLANGGHASTALGPLEVFRDARRLWNVLQGKPEAPRFLVRTATPGRQPVRPNGPFTILPDEALEDVGKTDIVGVPSIGLELEAALRTHAELISFVRDAHARGALWRGCAPVSRFLLNRGSSMVDAFSIPFTRSAVERTTDGLAFIRSSQLASRG